MTAANSPGMSDEQVEELLEALLEFRELLLGLNDRFQSRMALLEQEFAERRAAVNLPPGESQEKAETPAPSIERKDFKSAASAALAELDPEDAADEVESFDILDDEDAFDPDEEDDFSIVDFDDDDDF